MLQNLLELLCYLTMMTCIALMWLGTSGVLS